MPCISARAALELIRHLPRCKGFRRSIAGDTFTIAQMKTTLQRFSLLTVLLISIAFFGCGEGDRRPDLAPDHGRTGLGDSASAPVGSGHSDQWKERVLEDKTGPVIIRWNLSARGHAAVGRYPDLVGIAVAFVAPTPRGEPGAAELADLIAIEHRLDDTLTFDGASVYVAGYTGHGVRQFMFYTSDTSAMLRRIDAVRQSVRTHQIKAAVQHDPNWSVYDEWSGRDTAAQ